MNRINVLIIFLSILIIPVYSQGDDSRNRGRGFLMLDEPVNPRNVAMGSAGTALGGAGFRFYNPALPFFAGISYVTAEFGQMPGGVNKGGFETAMTTSEWFTAISFHSSTVGWETRNEQGFGTSTTSGTTFGALAAGYIRDNLAAGISVNLADDRIWVESNYTAVALSAGIGYKLLDGKLNLGAAGFHGLEWSKGFGEDAEIRGDKSVPKFARMGVAWMDTQRTFPYTAAMDVVYRDEDGTFTVPVGIDLQVLPVLSLRMGKRIGWDSEILSLGLGLNIDQISFDVAFVPSVFVNDYEIKWNMALTYGMGGRQKKSGTVTETIHYEIDANIGDGVDVDTKIDTGKQEVGDNDDVDSDIGCDADTSIDTKTQEVIGDSDVDSDTSDTSSDVDTSIDIDTETQEIIDDSDIDGSVDTPIDTGKQEVTNEIDDSVDTTIDTEKQEITNEKEL